MRRLCWAAWASRSAGSISTVRGVVKGISRLTHAPGPFEAGFSNGNGPTVCGTSSYYCTPGMDVSSCVQELYATCGASQKGAVDATLAGTSFGDTCGGHASPYHYHVDLGCEYASNSQAAPPSAHSPLVGIALDGRGIYGAWEGGAAPVLDSCN